MSASDDYPEQCELCGRKGVVRMATVWSWSLPPMCDEHAEWIMRFEANGNPK